MKSPRLCLAIVAAALATVSSALAEGTHTWKQSTFEEFEKGTAKGVAIRSDGSLELAPAFQAAYTSPSTYVWAIAADGQGNVYAAAGAPARIYRITPKGQASIVFQPEELQVQGLVLDTSGVLYAATSPDGKVYKIERTAPPDGKKKAEKDEKTEANRGTSALDPSFRSSLFFDPQTKYIWDLALDGEGRLYVATGDRGEIFRVDRFGESSLFFKSDEAHIRVLAFDTGGNLIAGSDGSGLIYRISPQGEAFVLYSAPKKEITALAVDLAGNIYAAGVGEKRRQPGVSFPQPAPAPTTTTTVTVQPSQSGGPQQAPPVPTPTPPVSFPSLTAAGGSEIYRIAPDGSPRPLWSSREDLVYALGFDERGRLLVGTGNKGRIFAIEERGEFTSLLKASATQVTAFANAPQGGLYVATSNLGKIFTLAAAPDSEGVYESDVFDAKIFSRWGRAEALGRGKFELQARSGNVDNPDRNWSPWQRVDLEEGGETNVPPARFIQWKSVLRPADVPPRIESVVVNYRPNNVAPNIEDVTVQVGTRYQPQPKPAEQSSAGGGSGAAQRFETPPPSTRDRDSIAARWMVKDDNDDELLFSIYYRGDAETQWKLLKDKISDKFYSWDRGLFPDGGYTLKVVASDAPSHSPDEALTDEKESARFEVDTTPPRIDNLSATLDNGQIHVTFRAVDNFSPVKRAEYSFNAGEWQFVEPVGLLSDSTVENYDFILTAPVGALEPATRRDDDRRSAKKSKAKSELIAEHVVVVRVYDRHDNMSSAKTVLRTK